MISASPDASPPANPLPLADRTGRAFAPDGWLARDLGLTHRPGQARMAERVAAALAGGDELVVEAGTGVGKSLAYLVPGLLWAVGQARPLVVSTHTIALQEQIERKDLPLCRRLFAARPELEAARDFRSCLLVGKANYLCGTRLARAVEERGTLLGGSDQAELLRLAQWASTTREGLLQEFSPPPPPEVWDLVNADSSVCTRRRCDPVTCPYQRARARLREANVIIVNHSLLFALLASGGGVEGDAGTLFPKDGLVLDEAHTVPEVATQHLGLHLTSIGLQRLLRSLWNPTRSRGLLHRHGRPAERTVVHETEIAAGRFFAALQNDWLGEASLRRVRTDDAIAAALAPDLERLVQVVEGCAARVADETSRDEVEDAGRRLAAWRSGLVQFTSLAQDDHVHWVERTGRQGQNTTLSTAPLDVAAALRAVLFTGASPVVLTSATLAPAGDLQPFVRRVGASRAAAETVLSPFDYGRQMAVVIVDDMPEPSAQERRLDLDWLAEWVSWGVRQVAGGTLVLFTSHADLRAVAGRIAAGLESEGRPLLVQGEGNSRTVLAERFRTAGNAVLCGTDSFWTGIDVPGPALSQVMVVRLPFEFPNHPVAEARSEQVRARGGSPFLELTLPDALVQFRQGIGRLIRSVDDHGVVTVLDSRVLTKPYGTRFLECLPRRGYVRLNRTNRDAHFPRRFPPA